MFTSRQISGPMAEPDLEWIPKATASAFSVRTHAFRIACVAIGCIAIGAGVARLTVGMPSSTRSTPPEAIGASPATKPSPEPDAYQQPTASSSSQAEPNANPTSVAPFDSGTADETSSVARGETRFRVRGASVGTVRGAEDRARARGVPKPNDDPASSARDYQSLREYVLGR